MHTTGILIDQSKCASQMNIEPTTLLPTARGPVLLAGLHIIGLPKQSSWVPTNNWGFLRLWSGFLLFLPPVFMFLSVRVILPLTLSLFASPHSPSLPHLALSGQFQFSSKNRHRCPIAKRVTFTPVLPPLSSSAYPSRSLLILGVETEKC